MNDSIRELYQIADAIEGWGLNLTAKRMREAIGEIEQALLAPKRKESDDGNKPSE